MRLRQVRVRKASIDGVRLKKDAHWMRTRNMFVEVLENTVLFILLASVYHGFSSSAAWPVGRTSFI